ncbi:MAG: DUF6492 family protein [Pseudomonadota bacterium]
MTKAFTIVTVTYRGDLGPFRDLCASVDKHMPGVEHHVLVDRSDWKVFAEFAGPKRTIIDCSKVLPNYRELNAAGRRIWVRWPFKIVRGWIYQQLAKIGYVQTLDCDAAVIVDSDAVFIRTIEQSDIFDGTKTKLYRCPDRPSGPPDQSAQWHDAASHALGLQPQGYTGADYISTAVIWSPAVLRVAIKRIEAVWGQSWDRVMTRFFRFSEYVIYGVFCDHVHGTHQDLIARTEAELCHCSWHYDLLTPTGSAQFGADLKDHHRAVLIQSNLGLSDEARQAVLDEFNTDVSAIASAS